eukprot:6357506-Alexandrium_andersonii.AAC.1
MDLWGAGARSLNGCDPSDKEIAPLACNDHTNCLELYLNEGRRCKAPSPCRPLPLHCLGVITQATPLLWGMH